MVCRWADSPCIFFVLSMDNIFLIWSLQENMVLAAGCAEPMLNVLNLQVNLGASFIHVLA